MEQRSPFVQRLKSISERRKLQELVLTTRLDLEQEKLRVQRLKRQSVREQWLMEGTLASLDDQVPPLREAETRIEELQQKLTSLHIQMQQLDNTEIWQSLQESLPDKSIRDPVEKNPSPPHPEMVDGAALSSSEGRKGAGPVLESTPDSPQRPMSSEAEKNLQNGEIQDGELSGNEGNPEEGNIKGIPVAMEKGDHWPHQGSSEGASVMKAGQSLDPSKAPASRQRKLAMEEMVIRDHLGQEVGCMDAVGQSQISLEKEEELEDLTNLGHRGESQSQPGAVDSLLDQNEEGPLAHELGSRHGPEGQSPTSQDLQSPSGLLKNENGYPKWQGDGLLEMDSLDKGEDWKGSGQKVVPEQGAEEVEPALAQATGAPVTECVKEHQGNSVKTQEWQNLGEGQGHERPGYGLEFTGLQDVKRSVLDQIPSSLHESNGTLLCCTQGHTQSTTLVAQAISPLPKVKPGALEHSPSSWHEMKGTITQQGKELLRHEFPDTISSVTNQLFPLPDQTVSLKGDAGQPALKESLVALQDQMPMPPEIQVPALPEADVFFPSQIPPSVDEDLLPCKSPTALLDWNPSALQVMESATPTSLQEVHGVLPDKIETLLPSHPLPNLPEDERSSPDQAPPILEDQTATSLLGQAPSFQEDTKPPPEEQNPSDPPKERANLAEQTPPSNKLQSPLLHDSSICPNVLPFSSQETLKPLLDQTEMPENQNATGSGDASTASAGAGEITEVLEHLHAEQQPLLKEATPSGAPLDISVADPQSKTGILKPQVATSQPAPTHSPTSANTASSHQLHTALPCPGEDQEQENTKHKHKSCQCCILM